MMKSLAAGGELRGTKKGDRKLVNLPTEKKVTSNLLLVWKNMTYVCYLPQMDFFPRI